MKTLLRTAILLVLPLAGIVSAWSGNGIASGFPETPPDTTKLRYPFKDRELYQPADATESKLYGKTPANISVQTEYDPNTGSYIISEKAGNISTRPPVVMSFKEYQEYDAQRALRSYWREKTLATKGTSGDGIIPSIYIGGQAFDKIFGGSTIDVRPNGSAELIFGVLANRRDDPSLNEKTAQNGKISTSNKKIQ